MQTNNRRCNELTENNISNLFLPLISIASGITWGQPGATWGSNCRGYVGFVSVVFIWGLYRLFLFIVLHLRKGEKEGGIREINSGIG